jgi:hypothetical protein
VDPPAGTVELAGRTVGRLGLSLAALRVTGMWGEPASRADAVATIRRAVELGVDVIEVPLPFGPAADLLRQSGERPGFLVARISGPLPGPDALRARLGRPPDLVLADEAHLSNMASWGIPLGALVGSGTGGPDPRTGRAAGGTGGPDPRTGRAAEGTGGPGYAPIVAVSGPSPAPAGLLGWCEARGLPYLAPDAAILAAGRATIALPPLSSRREVERLWAAGGLPAGRPLSPPGGGPG